jgi:hypothetical protein
MNRRDLLRAIARTTGDSISTIKRRGFHLEYVTVQEVRGKCKQRSPKSRNPQTKDKGCCNWECADE